MDVAPGLLRLRSLPWLRLPLRTRGGPADCHVTGGRRALRLPPRFAALCGAGEGGGRREGLLPVSPVAVMATYVSELEAAKKSLSEALGENVKQ